MKEKNTSYHYPKHPEEIKFPIYPGQLSGISRLHAAKSLFTATKSRLAEKLEKRYEKGVVLTSSGSAALVLALTYSGAGPGKEVILSSFNCPNVIDAVLQCGATPVFAQLEFDLSLSVSDARKKATRHTCAIILTHVYGRSENPEIIDWARANGIYIIDDAAQAMFTKQAGVYAGGLGDFGILSFGPSKPLASIGGGALIATKDFLCQQDRPPMEQRRQVIADYKHYMKNQRMQALMKRKHPQPISYVMKKTGLVPSMKVSKLEVLPQSPSVVSVLRMHPSREAIIENQLSKIDQLIKASAKNIETARERFEQAETTYGVQMIQPKEGECLNYLTIVFPQEEERYACSVYLAEKGIQTCWNYLPLDLIPIYQTYATQADENPLWNRVLSLPFKPPLTEEQTRQIAETVLKYAEHQNKN